MPRAPVDASASRAEPDGLDPLDPVARRQSGRVRFGVGAAIVLLLVSIAVAIIITMASSGSASTTLEPTESAVASSRPVVALVHVLGAVARPGLVELGADARVVDAIAAAGGLTADADTARVNLARTVTDGEQLVVPKIGEVAPTVPDTGGPMGEKSMTVNVNTADLAGLEELPGIGPALAQRIIDWRETNGGFSSIDDLGNVSGIGEKILAGLRDLVTT
jgi:competence protein ComEA